MFNTHILYIFISGINLHICFTTVSDLTDHVISHHVLGDVPHTLGPAAPLFRLRIEALTTARTSAFCPWRRLPLRVLAQNFVHKVPPSQETLPSACRPEGSAQLQAPAIIHTGAGAAWLRAAARFLRPKSFFTSTGLV